MIEFGKEGGMIIEELIFLKQEMVQTNAVWTFDLIKFETGQNYEYAYYIWKEGGIIQRFPYKKIVENTLTISYNVTESGNYKCQVFIKKKKKLIINRNTDICPIDRMNKKIMKTTYYNEQVYFNDVPVRYVFKESPIKSDILVICFSGISSKEFKGGPPVYNYIKTLDGLPIHRLYILDDFQNKFCYYLGKKGNREFERAINSLITATANELEIASQNIISTGSSKGGTAALYYALTYNYGHAIVGAPQIKISDFLKSVCKNKYMRKVYTFLHGENEKEMSEYYNTLLFMRMACNKKRPELFFHIGDQDYHYKEHLLPYLNYCDSVNVAYHLDIQSYSDHSQTGSFFSPFLRKTLTDILNNKRGKK